jgi:hypothetical protein
MSRNVGLIFFLIGTGLLLLSLFNPSTLESLPLASVNPEDYQLDVETKTTLPFAVTAEFGGATSTRWGRKTWIINGVYYVFWAEKGGVYYAFSTDKGETWSNPVFVFKGIYDYGEVFTTDYYNGVFGVMIKNTPNLIYRSGKIVNSYIDFGPAQRAYEPSNPTLGGGWADHYFAFDSNGYPWLSWTYHLEGGEEGVFVSVSDYNDRWVTREGYPKKMNSFRMCDRLQRLPNGRMYLFYGDAGGLIAPLCGNLYNGVEWEQTQRVAGQGLENVYYGESWSYDVVADSSGNMHLVYIDTDGNMRYSFYSYYGKAWSIDYEQVLVSGLESSCAARLAYDSVNNVVYLFWSPTGQSSSNASPDPNLYYKMYVNGKWQPETYTLISETENGGIARGDSINVVQNVVNGEIGMVYPVGDGSQLRYLLLKQKGYSGQKLSSRISFFTIIGLATACVGAVLFFTGRKER